MRRVAFLAWAVGAFASCAWNNGNPEIVAPHVEDHVFSVPEPMPPTIAWSARVAPTRDQTAGLESLRAGARAHRLASAGLREAESTACSGLSGDDLDVSAFFYRDDIVDVQPLRSPSGAQLGRLEGAVVTFRRVEGLSVRRLQRLVDCQIARDAALGYAAPETTWCPLALRGVRAQVAIGDRGLDVRLASEDADAAEQTYLRAVALIDMR